jgi:hypothetical protein
MDAAISTAANVFNMVFFLFEALRRDAGLALMPGLCRSAMNRV